MTIELTSEELALIEKKREEDKAKADANTIRHAEYVAKKVEGVEAKLQKQTNESLRLKDFYEQTFAELKKLSPDYELVVKTLEPISQVEIFNLDEDGYEITNHTDEFGNYIRLKPIDVIDVKGCIYNTVIKYTGKAPDNLEYKIEAIEHQNKWGSFECYKLRCLGRGFDSYDKRQRYISAKKAHEKLVDMISREFRNIEYRKETELRTKKLFDACNDVMKELSDKYPDASVTQLLSNKLEVKFNNGIRVNFHVDITTEGNTRTYGAKVEVGYGTFSVETLLELMSTIKGEE